MSKELDLEDDPNDPGNEDPGSLMDDATAPLKDDATVPLNDLDDAADVGNTERQD
ncbi:hypothetical protein [Pseudomonas trivialis]|uniref:Serine kinase/phosphatase n=1 Tax=Pseudomonas trivialis TaxID=200450 RepID=A0ABY0UKV4_9PSED|nr:hypothetical protein [Pseudomonas trivialis]SDS83997.1 hypothetical protein SAMN04490205_3818 [Pseudomonas trivialis]